MSTVPKTAKLRFAIAVLLLILFCLSAWETMRVGTLTEMRMAQAKQAEQIQMLRNENEALAASYAEWLRYQNDADEFKNLDARLARLRGDETLRTIMRQAEAEKNASEARVGFSPASTSPASLDEVFEMKDVDKPAILLANEEPQLEWPVDGEGNRLPAGYALISYVVDKNGIVRDPVVVEATGDAYVQAAMRVLKGRKFQPAEKGGAFVNARVESRFGFGSRRE